MNLVDEKLLIDIFMSIFVILSFTFLFLGFMVLARMTIDIIKDWKD